MVYMQDLTILYYSSNVLWDQAAQNVRTHLLRVTEGKIPIVSVTQKRLDFGHNIYVGEIGKSYYNCYKQILIGAKACITPYIACCEDDTLYPASHFTHRPSSMDIFSYNNHMWFFEKYGYWRKPGDHGMCGCIAPTELLIKTLEPRFKKYPTQPVMKPGQKERYWQEPGRYDRKYGIPDAKVELFHTKIPLLTFNYFKALGGKKKTEVMIPEQKTYIEGWGDGRVLWKKFWTGTI